MKQAAAFVGQRLRLFDVITHDGEDFIVLLWVAGEAAAHRKPRYVLPLKSVSHHVLDTIDPPYHYFLDDSLPESLTLGTATRRVQERFGVLEGPDVTFPVPPAPAGQGIEPATG